MSKAQISQANVHPLVLLSIVDHFNRVNLKQRNKRVVGALLGNVVDDVVEVVNSYAIPFE
jgi:26S proteasome regulatory subunit N8